MQLAAHILTEYWAIDPDHRVPYLLALVNMLNGVQVTDKAQADIERSDSVSYFASANGTGYEFTHQTDYWGNSIDAQMLDKLPKDSIAIHPFSGPIIKHNQACGPQGVTAKMRCMMMADRHPNVKAHVMKMESPGGSAVTMFNTNDFIKSLTKPVVTFIDDLSASAAYGISSSSHYIVANAYSKIGSIGTMATIIDDREFLEAKGIKLTELYADASTDKNIEFREALKGNFDPIKAHLNKYNDMFLSMVQTNRADKLTQGKDVWGTGKVFSADEAKSIGLIDDIGSLDSVIQSLINS